MKKFFRKYFDKSAVDSTADLLTEPADNIPAGVIAGKGKYNPESTTERTQNACVNNINEIRERLVADDQRKLEELKTSILKLLYIEDECELHSSHLFKYLKDVSLVKDKEQFQHAVMDLKFEGYLIILDEKIKLTGNGMKKASCNG